LPVFSFEEEAEMFLGFRDVDDDWRVRESGAGELVSVLYGPCAGVKEVALDPLPEMVVERTIGLVSLVRERFIGHIIERGATGGRCLGIREPGGWSTPCERSPRGEADQVVGRYSAGAPRNPGTR
jgi:hypothetical protein